jgi:hypothetical protein
MAEQAQEIVPFAGKSLQELETAQLADFNKISVSQFCALKSGKTFPKGTRASLKALVAMGVSKDNLKLYRKEHSRYLSRHHQSVRTANAIMNSHPDYVQTGKAWFNKAGDLCMNVAHRKVSVTKQSTPRVQTLLKRIEELEAEKVALLGTPVEATVTA